MPKYKSKPLGNLLKEVDRLFQKSADSKPNSATYFLYSLNLTNQGHWVFQVIDSWTRWFHKGYQTQFVSNESPQEAVQLFLNYVHKTKINVRKLRD